MEVGGYPAQPLPSRRGVILTGESARQCASVPRSRWDPADSWAAWLCCTRRDPLNNTRPSSTRYLLCEHSCLQRCGLSSRGFQVEGLAGRDGALQYSRSRIWLTTGHRNRHPKAWDFAQVVKQLLGQAVGEPLPIPCAVYLRSIGGDHYACRAQL